MLKIHRQSIRYGLDWKIQPLELPYEHVYRKLESPTTNTEKLKQELKQKFPEMFSGGLGKCTKIKTQFQVKDNVQPIFFKKRNVPFAGLEQINEELDSMGREGILSKTDFSVSMWEKNLIKLGFAPIFQQGWTKH